jgi:plastocyanin
MRPGFHIPAPRTTLALVAAALTLLTLAAASSRRAPAPAPALCSSTSAMSDAEMADLSAARYLASPAHGTAVNVAAADTFLVTNYLFDGDHNTGTLVDEVHITEGQSVMFKWVAGIHTTTSDTVDFETGPLWDAPVDGLHQETIVPFPTAGVYPFHCYFHGGLFNMVGTVVVGPAATPAARTTWGTLKSQYR